MQEVANKKLFTRKFYLLCLSSFFFFMSFNSILAELMLYFKDELQGNQRQVGLVIAFFTLVAGISRPFSGKLTDKIGRLPIMVVGVLAAFIASISYIFIEDIAILLGISAIVIFYFIRSFHGMSTGFKPTATTAYLADILPDHRRGEGMGWLGFAGSLGMAIGPELGNKLHLNYGYNTMFLVSALLALVSILVVATMKETLPKEEREEFSFKLLKINKQDIFEPLVLSPTLIFMLYATAFGAVYTLVPFKTEHLGMPELRGEFFTYYLVAAAISRVIAGRISDIVGRTPVILCGIIVVLSALLVIGWVESRWLMILGGVLYGAAHGIVGPSIFAWVTDLSDPKYRGRAFATMFIGMEIGIGAGAVISGGIYNGVLNNIFPSFLVIGGFNLLAIILTMRYMKKRGRD